MQSLCPNLFYLPGKSQATYTRFFTLIKDKIADSGLVFSPTSAMADFETEMFFLTSTPRDVFSTSPRVYGEKHRQQDFKYHTIPRQRRRQDVGSTSSNSTAYASCISSRRLVPGPRRPRQRRHHSVNSTLY